MEHRDARNDRALVPPVREHAAPGERHAHVCIDPARRGTADSTGSSTATGQDVILISTGAATAVRTNMPADYVNDPENANGDNVFITPSGTTSKEPGPAAHVALRSQSIISILL